MHIVSQALRARQCEPVENYVIGSATPYLLNRVAERMNAELRTALRPFRLTLRHWRVLAFLASSGPAPIIALARNALIPHSTLSRLCARMERAGVVRRTASGARDLRWATYALSRDGERLYRRALPHVVALNERLLDGLPPAHRTTMDRTLTRMLANITKEERTR